MSNSNRHKDKRRNRAKHTARQNRIVRGARHSKNKVQIVEESGEIEAVEVKE